MFCHKCGTQQLNDADFCQACGFRLIKDDKTSDVPVIPEISTQSTTIPQPTPIRIQKGEQHTQQSEIPLPSEYEPVVLPVKLPKKKMPYAIIGIIVAFVIIALNLVIWMINREQDEIDGVWIGYSTIASDEGNIWEFAFHDGLFYVLHYSKNAAYVDGMVQEGLYTVESGVICFELTAKYLGGESGFSEMEISEGYSYSWEFSIAENILSIISEDETPLYVLTREQTPSGLWSFNHSQEISIISTPETTPASSPIPSPTPSIIPSPTPSITEQYERTVTLGEFTIYGNENQMGWHVIEGADDDWDVRLRESRVYLKDFLDAKYLILEFKNAPSGGMWFAWVGDAGDESWPWLDTQIVPNEGTDDTIIIFDMTTMNGYAQFQRSKIFNKIYINYWGWDGSLYANLYDLELVDAYFAELK